MDMTLAAWRRPFGTGRRATTEGASASRHRGGWATTYPIAPNGFLAPTASLPPLASASATRCQHSAEPDGDQRKTSDEEHSGTHDSPDDEDHVPHKHDPVQPLDSLEHPITLTVRRGRRIRGAQHVRSPVGASGRRPTRSRPTRLTDPVDNGRDGRDDHPRQSKAPRAARAGGGLRRRPRGVPDRDRRSTDATMAVRGRADCGLAAAPTARGRSCRQLPAHPPHDGPRDCGAGSILPMPYSPLDEADSSSRRTLYARNVIGHTERRGGAGRHLQRVCTRPR
jgi:hypothetical protein